MRMLPPLQVNTTFDGMATDEEVLVSVVYLSSYEHMGQAKVSCLEHCECAGGEVNAHKTRHHVSLYEMFTLKKVGQHPNCTIQVEVLPDTTSGENKFKVTQVVVKGLRHATLVRRVL